MARYSVAKINQFLSDSDNAVIAKVKGAKLEELASYLFEKVPGIKLTARDVLDKPRVQEIDVAFWNPNRQSDLSFLDPVIIVECKNHKDPIGSDEIGWFVRKLQDRGANNGIFISLSGITGSSNGNSSAHAEILTAMIRDKIKILVIQRAELLALGSTKDLSDLLTKKYLKLTLEKSVS